MLSTIVLSNENQTCRGWEAPTSTGGGGCHKGHSPILSAVLVVALTIIVTMYLVGGVSGKTAATKVTNIGGVDSLRGRLFACGKFLFTKETLDK